MNTCILRTLGRVTLDRAAENCRDDVMIAVTALALAAALLFALSAFLQRRAAHDALDGHPSPLAFPS